jgi:hypothetical protein
MSNKILQTFSELSNKLPVATVTILKDLYHHNKLDNPKALLNELTEYKATLTNALDKNEFLDFQSATQIQNVLNDLLQNWISYPLEHQAMIALATLYFIEENDAESDTQSILGLEDDLQVVNKMLETIGRLDLHIQP